MTKQKAKSKGERLETVNINFITIEHLHRYAIASTFCWNKVVLDIASGEGYGTNLLANSAAHVIGIDISEEAISDARSKYIKENLSFRTGSAADIPLESGSVDVVVSFETIEHHDQHIEMMKEIKRVLRKNGVLIMSSPDKKYYSELPKFTNPFHVKELYFDQFKQLVSSYFENVQYLFQKSFTGSVVVPETLSGKVNLYEGNFQDLNTQEDFKPVYNLCIASDEPVEQSNISLFDGDYASKLFLEEVVNSYRSSWSYKIGRFVLAPVRFFKKLS